MATPFIPLPPEAFPEAARPSIERLNVFLLELSRLEGALRQPATPRRSDQSIARRSTVQVDISRITPSISEVVSGVSTVVGTPSLTLGTTNTVGSTTTAVSINSTIALFDTTAPSALGSTAATGSVSFGARRDHQHLFPPTLQSTANASTLTLTDDATDQTLTGSLGALNVTSAGAFTLNASGRINFNLANSASASTFIIAPSTTASESNVVTVQGRPTAGNRTLMAPNWFTPASGDTFSSVTFRCWDVQFTSFAGQHTSSTFVGYDVSSVSIAPSSGSTSGNRLYAFRNGPIGSGFSINNANASWAEVAGAYFKGFRRSITSPKIDVQAALILEPPTGASTTQAGAASPQIGLLIRQQTAQVTAAERAAIWVDAQNSGTSRYSFYGVSDTLYQGGVCQIGGKFEHDGTLAGLYGATPTIQFGTTGTASGFAAGTSTAVTVDSTFTGNTGTLAYTIGDAIRALKMLGALAY